MGLGDRVMTHAVPFREQGSWTEQLIADGDLLASKPEDASWDKAAAFPVPALTADQALREVTTTTATGQLLVHGAGGVTGGMIVALARVRGTRVIATAGPGSTERLRRLGAETVYDYHDQDWPNAVVAFTEGAGVPAAVNAVRGDEPATLSSVATGGRLRRSLEPRPSRSGACRSPTSTCMPTASSYGSWPDRWRMGSSKSLSALSTARRRSGGAGARDKPRRSGSGRAPAVTRRPLRS